MSQDRNTSQLPSNLKSTLLELEGTISQWEKVVPETTAAAGIEEKDILEKELQKKARELLFKLKSQIDDLS